MWNGLSSYASDAIGVAVWPCRLSRLSDPSPRTYTHTYNHAPNSPHRPVSRVRAVTSDSCTTDAARRIPCEMCHNRLSRKTFTRNPIIPQSLPLLPKVIFVFFLASHSRSRGLIVPLGNSVTIAAFGAYYVFAWRETKRSEIFHMTRMTDTYTCMYYILRKHHKIEIWMWNNRILVNSHNKTFI